jgi:large subunit ribosomal protein L21
MYAIIESGGKQYRVEKGLRLQVEKVAAGADNAVVFEKVLTIVADDGDSKLGRPYLPGASVTAEYVADGKGDKIIVHKYKRRKKYRLTRGHRQPYTEVVIKEINS